MKDDFTARLAIDNASVARQKFRAFLRNRHVSSESIMPILVEAFGDRGVARNVLWFLAESEVQHGQVATVRRRLSLAFGFFCGLLAAAVVRVLS